MLRVADLVRRDTGIQVNRGDLQAAAGGFVQAEGLVEALQAHTAIPTGIERLAVIDAISRSDNSLVIDGVGKPDPRSNTGFERIFGIVLAVAGRLPICFPQRQACRDGFPHQGLPRSGR